MWCEFLARDVFKKVFNFTFLKQNLRVCRFATSAKRSNQVDPDEEDWRFAEKDVREFLRIPSSGHKVFVLQPFIKWGTMKKRHTRPELQITESIALVNTLPGWTVVGHETVSLESIPRNKTKLIGKGKTDHIHRILENLDSKPSAVFFNHDSLSPAQINFYQEEFHMPVFDRFAIVLQIFRLHARTREAKLQVSLAEIPLLRKSVTARIGTTTCGEETWKLEKIKLRLGSRESRLRSQLSELRQHRERIRKNRVRNDLPVVAVVGYTNSGKTSFIKCMTGEEKLIPKDQLFATLDVTAHAGTLRRSGIKILLIDTVGFVADVPIPLISSFRATLEDVLLADLVVHVKDVSNPNLMHQEESVLSTLKELGLPQPMFDSMITVDNKVDLVPGHSPRNAIPVSCKTFENVQLVAEMIEEKLMEARNLRLIEFRVSPGGEEHFWLKSNCALVEESDLNVGGQKAVLKVSALVSDVDLNRMRKYCPQLLLKFTE